TGPAVADLTWVITAYAVLFAAVLTPAGRLADVVGRRRLYVTGVGLFTLMSLACAVAPNRSVLVAARAVQGAGAAAMIPAWLALSTRPPATAVETSLWRSRGFAVANVASLLYGATLYAWLLIGVLFLTEVWRYSELKAGLAMSPGAFTAAASAVAGGRLIARF